MENVEIQIEKDPELTSQMNKKNATNFRVKLKKIKHKKKILNESGKKEITFKETKRF